MTMLTPGERRRNRRLFWLILALVVLTVSCLMGWARAGAPLPHFGKPQAGSTWVSPPNSAAQPTSHPSGTTKPPSTAPAVPGVSAPASARPSSPAPPPTGATPTPGVATPPLVDQISWRQECPVGGHRFCVTFPHPTDQINDGYDQVPLASATSRSNSRMSFFTKVWIGPHDAYCTSARDHRCLGPRRGEETFFVDIIKDSKYSASPWRAITALNGGVAQHPAFSHFKGRLAVKFNDHATGHTGMTLWHHGWVYYLGVYASDELPTSAVEANFARFRDSFRPV
jgi:hypothetical protein